MTTLVFDQDVNAKAMEIVWNAPKKHISWDNYQASISHEALANNPLAVGPECQVEKSRKAFPCSNQFL